MNFYINFYCYNSSKKYNFLCYSCNELWRNRNESQWNCTIVMPLRFVMTKTSSWQQKLTSNPTNLNLYLLDLDENCPDGIRAIFSILSAIYIFFLKKKMFGKIWISFLGNFFTIIVSNQRYQNACMNFLNFFMSSLFKFETWKKLHFFIKI